ncbi:MAG: hypothetical protein EZS28_008792 [Streblomastix strix]|uniref:IBB domain-containing protein n=1 Tax=Streblomastix strix TaxID=222440 RepID=A0A5J4WM98_9EUKA|nr:MAG: hypothetical protein EZS28_008792 [Streblomastix strix]
MDLNIRSTLSDLRKKRNDNAISLRRAHREMTVAHRRANISNADSNFSPKQTASKLPELINSFQSPDIATVLNSLQDIRSLAAVDDMQIKQLIIHSGALPFITNFLEMSSFPRVQSEATLIIVNLTCISVTHIQDVVKAGVIPKLADIVRTSKILGLVQNALWALGNIAYCSDIYICKQIVDTGILQMIDQYIKIDFIQQFTPELSKKNDFEIKIDQENIEIGDNELYEGEGLKKLEIVKDIVTLLRKLFKVQILLITSDIQSNNNNEEINQIIGELTVHTDNEDLLVECTRIGI